MSNFQLGEYVVNCVLPNFQGLIPLIIWWLNLYDRQAANKINLLKIFFSESTDACTYHFLKHVSRSPHTNNQYESQIFATNFCLLTFLVNIGKIKVLN